MKIIVVGAGNVGFNVTEKLQKERHDIILIDADSNRIHQVRERLDALVMHGNGADPSVLEQAGARGADMLLAVTDSDEVNILCCLVAGHFNIQHKLARINSRTYFDAPHGLTTESLGIDHVIYPEEVCASEVRKLLKHRSVFEMHEFHEGKAQLVGFRVQAGNALIGKKLSDFSDEMLIEAIRIVAISRAGKILIPYGKHDIRLDDEVYIMGRKDSVPEFLEICGLKNPETKRVIVTGSNQAVLSLAKSLEHEPIETRLIVSDGEQARKFSEVLKNVLVIGGEPTERASLIDAGVGHCDVFVALTSDDENNVVSCIVAKDLGAQYTIASVNKFGYGTIVAHAVKIDATVSTRLATINAVLRFVRKGKVVSALELQGLSAEVMEMVVTTDAGIHNKKIRELKFPEQAIIGVVIRGTQVLPAIGDLKLLAGDRAVILTIPEAVPKVEQFFSKKHLGIF